MKTTNEEKVTIGDAMVIEEITSIKDLNLINSNISKKTDVWDLDYLFSETQSFKQYFETFYVTNIEDPTGFIEELSDRNFTESTIQLAVQEFYEKDMVATDLIHSFNDYLKLKKQVEILTQMCVNKNNTIGEKNDMIFKLAGERNDARFELQEINH